MALSLSQAPLRSSAMPRTPPPHITGGGFFRGRGRGGYGMGEAWRLSPFCRGCLHSPRNWGRVCTGLCLFLRGGGVVFPIDGSDLLRNLGHMWCGFRLLLRRVTSGMVWCDPVLRNWGRLWCGLCLFLRGKGYVGEAGCLSGWLAAWLVFWCRPRCA